MNVHEVYTALGEERFRDLTTNISMGSLRTYKLFETVKIRARLSKLNRAKLRQVTPKLWGRLVEGDEPLAKDLAQAILVSHLEFVVKALDFLGISHDGNGFFDKDDEAEARLDDGWQQRTLDNFRESQPEALVLFYINHLDLELGSPETVFVG